MTRSIGFQRTSSFIPRDRPRGARRGGADHKTVAALALGVVVLISAAGCGSPSSGAGGGAGGSGGRSRGTGGGSGSSTGGGSGSSTVCKPLEPTACTQGQGCYFDRDAMDFVCSKAGSAAASGACLQDTDCVARNVCNGWDGTEDTGVCKPYCSVQSGSGCMSPDVCVDVGDPVVGICGSCPTVLKCGSECCGATQVCVAGACSDAVACDEMKQDCTATGQACYIHWGSGQFACQPSTGNVAVGKTCEMDTDCVKSSGCYYAASGATSGVCTPYCRPAASPTTCQSGQTCEDVLGDGSLGYCR